MLDAPKLLAVIPARAGSRGVPGKNLQLISGVPLVLHTIRTVISSGQAARVVVSTNDPAVAALARIHGVEVIDRPEVYATPEVTIETVLRHATQETGWEGLVAAFQPTCPLLTPTSIQRAVGAFRVSERPWGITAVRARHLTWFDGRPLTRRLNRQYADPVTPVPLEEVGAITIATTDALLAGSLDPDSGTCLPLPDHEALDIDTPADLAAARQAAGRRNVLIEIACGKAVGSGHLYRAIRLAEGLAHHHVGITFVGETPTWALEMLDLRGLWWEGCESVFDDAADLVIFDALDTTAKQVTRRKSEGKLVVTFEDEGDGALYADLTVNELLPTSPYRNVVTGPDYTILRPEFLGAPERPTRDRLRNVLISFGGTDPAGLNDRARSILAGYDTLVMAGPGTPAPTARNMAQCMATADLVVTSQGRTQFEAAALGVPAITIAANEREARHVRCPGHLHLGLHAAVGDHLLAEAVHRLSGDPALRAEMGDTARKAVDGRGLDRVVWRIDGLLAGLT